MGYTIVELKWKKREKKEKNKLVVKLLWREMGCSLPLPLFKFSLCIEIVHRKYRSVAKRLAIEWVIIRLQLDSFKPDIKTHCLLCLTWQVSHLSPVTFWLSRHLVLKDKNMHSRLDVGEVEAGANPIHAYSGTKCNYHTILLHIVWWKEVHGYAPWMGRIWGRKRQITQSGEGKEKGEGVY